MKFISNTGSSGWGLVDLYFTWDGRAGRKRRREEEKQRTRARVLKEQADREAERVNALKREARALEQKIRQRQFNAASQPISRALLEAQQDMRQGDVPSTGLLGGGLFGGLLG